jgi:hypothetical protein
MIKRFIWIALSLTVVFMIGAMSHRMFPGQSIQAQATKANRATDTRKWEYVLIRASNSDDLLNKANSMGEQGWELTGQPCDNSFMAYFKRPKS